MKRGLLILIAFTFAVACAAWRAHAGVGSFAGRASAGSPASPFPPVPSPTTLRKIDEYGDIRWVDEKARLDNLAVEARNDPAAVSYLVCYGGRKAVKGEAARKCARAARHLVRTRGLDAGHVVTLDGGFREDLTVELWLLPAGVGPPTPTPTVDPSEVKFVRPPRRRGRGRR